MHAPNRRRGEYTEAKSNPSLHGLRRPFFFGSGGRAFGPARAAGPRPACVGGADTYGERQLLEIQAGVRPYISLAPADC